MRKAFTRTALTALLALPLIIAGTDASASCQGRKTTGTVIGGVGGALLGNAISHGGAGAVIGGVGGAVAGHEIAKSGCTSSRTAYYRHGRHRSRYAAATRHANGVYYDRYGNVVSR